MFNSDSDSDSSFKGIEIIPPTPTSLAEAVENIPRGLSSDPPLPGPYRSSEKLLLTKALVYDYVFNTRGIESPYHGLYSHHFTEWLAPYPNLVPFIQFSLWLNKTSEVDTYEPRAGVGHGTGDDIGSEQQTTVPRDSDVASVMIEGDEADTSFSSAHTVPNEPGWERFPDLSVVHARFFRMAMQASAALEEHYHHSFVHLHGCRAYHACCAILGEFKRGPPRGLYNSENNQEIQKAFL
ncbi:hypothetical protein V5O48_018018 [Marasmius crinis-equi]|uniref:Uncharacterized protein n=1 Tax=Marasmius crinis-equi TaxID=585013 RepID=A0ABR3EMJ0_9AGAR